MLHHTKRIRLPGDCLVAALTHSNFIINQLNRIDVLGILCPTSSWRLEMDDFIEIDKLFNGRLIFMNNLLNIAVCCLTLAFSF